MSTVLGLLVLSGLVFFTVIQVKGLIKAIKLKKQKAKEKLKKGEDTK